MEGVCYCSTGILNTLKTGRGMNDSRALDLIPGEIEVTVTRKGGLPSLVPYGRTELFIPRRTVAGVRVHGLPEFNLAIEMRDGRVRCTGLSTANLTARFLRAIPLQECIQAVIEHELHHAVDGHYRPAESDADGRRLLRDARLLEPAQRNVGGRGQKVADATLRRVASLYREATVERDGEWARKPSHYIAEVMGVRSSIARQWVRHARKRGLLRSAFKGRSGEASG